ncbi:MAG: ABC transporter permease [Anaerolineae bacterium]|nr:ABC transporter permease [Anaerolineae bacterium]
MSELTIEKPPKKKRFRNLRENPVTVKELRSRMRGRRAFVVLTVYLLVMGAFITLVYAAYASAASGPFGPDPREVGKVIFGCVVGVQVFLVIFVGPSFTAGTITGEKERQTYDLLRTTLLSAESFVTGKLFSALSYVFLLVLAAIPLQSIAFLLGGVTLEELIISQLIVFVAAISFALWGLFCSSAMRSTLGASVMTFAGALFVTMGTPMLAGLFIAILAPFLALSGSISTAVEIALQYILILMFSTNLPATLIASEVFLLEDGAIFFFKSSTGGSTYWLPSPWPIFMVLYILLAWLLYWLSVRNVRKIANR